MTKINRISVGEHAVRMSERRQDYFDRIPGADIIYCAAEDAKRKTQLSRRFRRRVESRSFQRWLSEQARIAAATVKRRDHKAGEIPT